MSKKVEVSEGLADILDRLNVKSIHELPRALSTLRASHLLKTKFYDQRTAEFDDDGDERIKEEHRDWWDGWRESKIVTTGKK